MQEEFVYSIVLDAPVPDGAAWLPAQYVALGSASRFVSRFDLTAMSAHADTLAQADGQTYLVEQFYAQMPGVPGKIVHRTSPGLAQPTLHRATYTNGNRELTIRPDGDRFALRSNVWDGTKWQIGPATFYQTFAAAQRAAIQIVAKINTGWTAQPEWTVS
jgi:hypothetical protein